MPPAPSTRELDDLLTDAAFVQDPYPIYALLRARAPVHWCAPWGAWVVTRYDDVVTVLGDAATFSSAGYEAGFLDDLTRAHGLRLPNLRAHFGSRVVSFADPPEHGRLRRPIVRGLGPRVLPVARRLTERLIAERVDTLGEESVVDLVADYAYPIPALVIAGLLGVPDEDRESFCAWSEAVVGLTGAGSAVAERALAAEHGMAAFRHYLAGLLDGVHEPGRDDLMATLARGGDGDEPLTDAELVATCVVLIFAGHETTANLVANAIVALLAAPAELEALRGDPELLGPAVEEALRYDGSVQRARRVATRPVELGGVTIAAGERVLAFTGAANRDPGMFANPDRFDVRRRPTRHLAFGHGRHFCVGAALARMEAPLMLGALLERFRALRLAEPVRFRDNIVFRGPTALRITHGEAA